MACETPKEPAEYMFRGSVTGLFVSELSRTLLLVSGQHVRLTLDCRAHPSRELRRAASF